MLLAVDSSTQWIGLALYDGAMVISEMTWKTANHHSVEISPAIKSMLDRSQVKMEQLTALGVARGPGSFTSLRIGLAVVKGLAFALHIPVIGVPTLDFLAAGVSNEKSPLMAVLRAGRHNIACQKYLTKNEDWIPEGDAYLTTVHGLEQEIRTPTWVVGELDADDRQLLKRRWKNVKVASPAESLRRPAMLAELAWKRFQAGEVDDPTSLAPIYIHINEGIPA
jgi:tRNA threonylcarbamoyladenosine biosynthesis protein TsaB